jgi:menaquinone-dependent protoporphyrinogen oxidase
VGLGLFVERLEKKKLPLYFRLISKAMKAPEGKFRDWDAIRAWVEALTALVWLGIGTGVFFVPA